MHGEEKIWERNIGRGGGELLYPGRSRASVGEFLELSRARGRAELTVDQNLGRRRAGGGRIRNNGHRQQAEP